ncbi:MAG TPA: copper homeostasis protein CutC [Chitinophagaceae bacterium]|nr:copper homeostasis protein CutC [Chitinophagaceae bacterium]
MSDKNFIIEIATTDFITTQAAVAGGADRIELCAGLSEGGITPSPGHIRNCRESFNTSIYTIIRPRGGDFLYSGEEFDIMLQDVIFCKQVGCDGIVTGLLHKDGSIDVSRTAALVDAAYPLGVTFHRAFDRCADPFRAMEELIDIGCERILTSGLQTVAMEGAALIAKLNDSAANRIIIMPGSGVRKENIGELAALTGCVEFHSSLRRSAASEMNFIQPPFAGADYLNPSIDPEEVRKLRSALS